ncbi:hypothetical protein RRG08_055061 [Elysia crispata]|uniref:Uncharacterized protein n=1 Tax=Elysia crispata TaxID=231223 RepID=A0AAE1B0I2_9GAST|nr:hypothetical protein RRG08_055061 [Elysia crispata]
MFSEPRTSKSFQNKTARQNPQRLTARIATAVPRIQDGMGFHQSPRYFKQSLVYDPQSAVYRDFTRHRHAH